MFVSSLPTLGIEASSQNIFWPVTKWNLYTTMSLVLPQVHCHAYLWTIYLYVYCGMPLASTCRVS